MTFIQSSHLTYVHALNFFSNVFKSKNSHAHTNSPLETGLVSPSKLGTRIVFVVYQGLGSKLYLEALEAIRWWSHLINSGPNISRSICVEKAWNAWPESHLSGMTGRSARKALLTFCGGSNAVRGQPAFAVRVCWAILLGINFSLRTYIFIPWTIIIGSLCSCTSSLWNVISSLWGCLICPLAGLVGLEVSWQAYF